MIIDYYRFKIHSHRYTHDKIPEASLIISVPPPTHQHRRSALSKPYLSLQQAFSLEIKVPPLPESLPYSIQFSAFQVFTSSTKPVSGVPQSPLSGIYCNCQNWTRTSTGQPLRLDVALVNN